MHEVDDPLAWFGLEPDASLRDLKRAYAQRLKAARPDEDPDGFQALRAMYESALWMLEEANGDAPNAEAIEVEAQHASPTQFVTAHTGFDLEALYREILAFGRADDAAGLRTWLLSHETLWSLLHKGIAADAIACSLWTDLPPFGRHAFDVLAAFFDEWRIDRGVDPIDAGRLRETLIVRWYLLSEHAAHFEHSMVETRHAATPRAARLWLRQLKRPFAHWQVLLLALIPGVPTRLRALLQWLGVDRIALPPEIDPRQIAFWNAAGDRRVLSQPRTLVGLSRSVVYAFASMLPFAHEMANPIAFAMNTTGMAVVYAAFWFGAAMAIEERDGTSNVPGSLPAWGLLFGLVFAATIVKSCVSG